eukprot:2339779-Amphidinium_carterae.2
MSSQDGSQDHLSATVVSESTCMSSQAQDHLESTCVSYQVHEASTALKVSIPEWEYTHVIGELASFGVPETKSRTNVGACRSQLFGLYTRRGVGITSVTIGHALKCCICCMNWQRRESPRHPT